MAQGDIQRRYFGARLGLSIGLIGFLFYTTDTRELGAIISRGDVSYLFLAFLIVLCDRLLMAYKWNILLRAKAIRIPLTDLTGTYLIATFWGMFLPATVGGDVVRAYAVSKEGHKATEIISSIIMERVVGLLALLVFLMVSMVAAVMVFGQELNAGMWTLQWTILIVLCFVGITLILSFYRRLPRALRTMAQQWKVRIPGNWLTANVQEIYTSYREYREKPRYLVAFLVLSIAENLLPILWTYCVALAFSLQVPLLYFFILMPIVLVLVRLPISLGGIGIHEWTFVYILALVGIPKGEALVLGLASHLVAIFGVLPGGILYCVSGLSFRSPWRSKRVEYVRLPVQSEESACETHTQTPFRS